MSAYPPVGGVDDHVALLKQAGLGGLAAGVSAEVERMRFDRADIETENARLLADNTRLLEQNALLKREAEQFGEDRDRYATLLDGRVRRYLNEVCAHVHVSEHLKLLAGEVDNEISAAHVAAGTIVKESAA